MNTQPFMSGFELRLAYSNAVSLIVIDTDAGHEALSDVLHDAKCKGMQSFSMGIKDVPVMFKDTPCLEDSWGDGWYFAAETEEMNHCSSCQDPEGTLCPFHDR